MRASEGVDGNRRAGPKSASVSTPPVRIGDLAALAGVSADTLRYYERRGLLQPAGRRASG